MNIRVFIKSALLIFGLIAVFNNVTDCCQWLHFGDVPVRHFTAYWMLMSALIALCREPRRAFSPLFICFAEFTLCIIGIAWAVGALFMSAYGVNEFPSVGTMFGFTLYWSIHLLLQIERVKGLKECYFAVTFIGLLSLTGHVLKVPQLYFDFGDLSNAMAVTTALFLIVLSIACYWREKEGK